MHRFATIALLLLALLLPACGETRSTRLSDESRPAMRTASDARQPVTETVALLNGRAITRSDLWAPLGEAAGATVIEESVLDRMLSDALRREGISITDADVSDEDRRLREAIVRENNAAESAAPDLLDQLRRSRGLGPVRYPAFLRRNAAMRALVRDSIAVAEDEIWLAHEIRHGERFDIRVIVTPTEREASAVRARIASSPGSIGVAFAEAAIDSSTDATAARGGLLTGLSASDPAYDEAVRRQLPTMPVGAVSPVIAADSGYVLVYMAGRIPASGVSLQAERSRIEQDLRRRKERLAIEGLARDLLRSADLTVLDRSLGWNTGRDIR